MTLDLAWSPDTGGLSAALASVRTLVHGRELDAQITLTLAAGLYTVSDTLDASGLDDVEIRAAQPDSVRISGSMLVGPWSRVAAAGAPLQTWRAALPSAASPRQMWVDGTRAERARHPNVGYLCWEAPLAGPFASWGFVYEAGQGLERFGERLVGVDAVAFHSWCTSRHRVARHDPAQRMVLFDRPSNQPFGAHLRQSGRRFLLEGFDGAADAAGEFAVEGGEGDDGGDRALLYVTPAGDDPNARECRVATAGLTALLAARASSEAPTRGLRLTNLTFEHTDWVLPPPPAVADFQAAAFLSDAALHFAHATAVELRGVRVRHTGGYGIWLAEGAVECVFVGSELRDLGGGGLRIGVAELAAAPAAANELRDSVVLGGGHVFREAVGVLVQRSQRNVIARNEIGERTAPPRARHHPDPARFA